jgi:hypothetical protein
MIRETPRDELTKRIAKLVYRVYLPDNLEKKKREKRKKTLTMQLHCKKSFLSSVFLFYDTGGGGPTGVPLRRCDRAISVSIVMAQSFLFENGQLGPPVEVAFDWDDGAAAAGPSSSTEDGATSIAVLERAVRETFGLDDFLAFGIVYAPVARKGLSPVPITTRADVEYCARLQRTLLNSGLPQRAQ